MAHDPPRWTAYLAGPIAGMSDAEAKDWRGDLAASLLPLRIVCLDPMRRDYRGADDTLEMAIEIVEQDKDDIDASDAVLAYCPIPSVGTSMEIHYAWSMGKIVVVVVPDGVRPSPWLRYHATHLVRTFEDGTEALLRELEKGVTGPIGENAEVV